MTTAKITPSLDAAQFLIIWALEKFLVLTFFAKNFFEETFLLQNFNDQRRMTKKMFCE